jgi:hypothetical protein
VPSGPPIAQQHVLTADYLGGHFGTRGLAWSRYAPWLTLAETDPLDARPIGAAGIKTMLYTDPNRIGINDPIYSLGENVFAHTCSGDRLVDNLHLTLTNPNSAALRSSWKRTVTKYMDFSHADYLRMDDANNAIGGMGALRPCAYDPNAWLASTRSLISTVPYKVIYNRLGVGANYPGFEIPVEIALNDVAAGGMMEGCYLSIQRGKYKTPIFGIKFWLNSENVELRMAAERKTFLCYTTNTMDSASSHDLRMFAYASFLLTYDPQSSVLWEYFRSPSGFHVQPETKLVPKQPLLPAPKDISGLLTSTGVYGREYAQCYVGGTSVGACATVVNPDPSSSHAFPYSRYHHSLILNGGGALDGGTIDINGPSPPPTLPSLGSAIVFQ